MANTKISGFPQVKNNDVPLITGFAAVGTDGNDNVGVNVKITGTSLITSLEQQLDLDNFLKGTLAVGRGGTGATTFTANGILIGNTTNAISATAELADGQLLIGGTGNAPSPATLTAGADITITNANGSITIANAAPNQATPAAGISGQLQYNDGSNGFAASANLTFDGVNDILTVQDNIVIKGDGTSDASKLKFNCYNNNHHVEIIGPDHSNSPLSYSITLPNKIATQSAVSGGRVLEVNASGVGNWIATPTDTDTSIYAADGNLTADRTVTMNNVANNTPYNLTFAGITTSKVTFSNLGGVEIARDLTVQKNVIIQGQGYSELHAGATIDGIDWDSGNVQEVTLPAGSSDFDPSNPKAGATYILKITQPSGGDGTINWDNIGAANIKWPGGTEPTLTATNAAIDIVTLICTDATGQGVYYANATLNFS